MSMHKTIEVIECICQCGHRWIAESMPVRCAKCKSRKWDEGETKSESERIKENDDVRGTGSSTTGTTKRSGNDAAVSDVRQSASTAVGLRAVQPVRDQLVPGRGVGQASESEQAGLPEKQGQTGSERCTKAGHVTFRRSGEWWCMTCSAGK